MKKANNVLWRMINDLLEASTVAAPLIKKDKVRERLFNAIEELALFRDIAIILDGTDDE